MQQNQFLLYGAYGYTGELIARFAQEYNLQPVLAGRREKPLKAMSEKLGFPYKVIDLADSASLEAALQEVKVVIHAAGPFDHTAKPMVDACLKTRTHYLDINGDLDVFRALKEYDSAAKEAGITILPGAGFDVVPTDCMALFLKKLLPAATSLKIAFATPGGGLSHGTAMTTAAKLGEPGAVRQEGKIVPVPVGHKGMDIEFFAGQNKPPKKLFVMSLPWGDVYTAYETTGIPNIEAYTHVNRIVFYILKFQSLFNGLLRTSFVRNMVKKKIDRSAPGLNDDLRTKATSLVWGQVINGTGKTVTARSSGPDAYTLTAYATLLITQKILAGNFKTGYQTPAGAYSENLVMEIGGVEREIVSK